MGQKVKRYSFNELAEQFGCTSWSIRMWVKRIGIAAKAMAA
ncbi:MAG: hypothetical protein ABI645_12065 [Pseudomonadota bacterium]